MTPAIDDVYILVFSCTDLHLRDRGSGLLLAGPHRPGISYFLMPVFWDSWKKKHGTVMIIGCLLAGILLSV